MNLQLWFVFSGREYAMRKFVLAVVLVLMSSGAQAATPIVVEGQLIGASGVDVGGKLYDVSFGDGSCISLFNGCDEDSDFPFPSLADGLLAAQALADQVFNSDSILGSFDSEPGLTRGCLHSPEFDYCTILIPHAPAQGVDPDPPAGFISVTGYRNLPAGGVLTEPGVLSLTAVTLDSTFSTKAVFSPQAATLIVVEGQLIGASGVDVGGKLYDVSFGDGSCVFLFNGCDEDSDFPFPSLADGLLAAQALADQVFNSDSILGSFDSDPGLTRGCHGLLVSDYCIIYIPHALAQGGAPAPPPGFISVTGFRNFNPMGAFPNGVDGIHNGPWEGGMNINTSSFDTFTSTKAVFSLHVVHEPVPTLPPLGLVLLSALMMGLASRRLARENRQPG
jgi:hypothetical protein